MKDLIKEWTDRMERFKAKVEALKAETNELTLDMVNYEAKAAELKEVIKEYKEVHP